MIEKDKISQILDLLEEAYPEAECALHHQDVFQLIVAVALSAQTTDKSVNQVTPALFAQYPTPQALAEADPEDVAAYIKRIGMYKTKSKNIVAMAQKLCSDFGGEVPDDYDALISLPGVGRKTANVVRTDAYRGGYTCFSRGKSLRDGTRKGRPYDRACADGEDPRRTLVPYASQLDFSWQTVLRRAQTEMRRLSNSHLLRIR